MRYLLILAIMGCGSVPQEAERTECLDPIPDSRDECEPDRVPCTINRRMGAECVATEAPEGLTCTVCLGVPGACHRGTCLAPYIRCTYDSECHDASTLYDRCEAGVCAE